jgi:hypothetical protein
MRRRTAVILCLITLGLVLALDVVLLTNAHVLGRIAAIQIRKHAGNLVDFERLTVSLGGTLRMERMALRTPDPARPVLSARRVIVAVGHREGGIVAESGVLEEARLRFSDAVARDLGSGDGTPKRPLRDLVSSRYLPRITCKGGTLELGHSDVLAAGTTQIFHILDLAMVPTTGYRYFVRGRLRNAVLGDWAVQGEIDLDTGDHRVRLSTGRLELGTPIRDSLKPALQDLWDKYKPSGPAEAEVHLVADAGATAPEPAFRFTLRPRGMSLLYRNFAYPCEDVRGEMEFRADGFTIKNIEARSGKTTKIRFDGSAGGYEAADPYHFRVELDDVPFDDKLKSALSAEARDVWGHFKPSGKMDARATVHKDRGGPEVKERIPVDLHLKDVALTYSGFPYLVEHATGEVRIDGDEVIIKRIQGTHGRTNLRISGRVDEVSKDAVVDLDVQALTLELDGKLRDALAPKMREVFDRVGASGEIDLDVRIVRLAGSEPHIRALARAKGNRMLFRDLPIPILLREGNIEFDGDKVRLDGLKGTVDPSGDLMVTGQITTGASGTTTHLEVDGLGISIDERFRSRMPGAVADALKTLKVSGIADVKLTYDERPERERTSIRVRVQMDLRKGTIGSEVPMEDIDGTVVLVGPIRDGKPMLSGRVDIRSARVAKKLVRNLRTNVALTGSVVDLRDITADVYGGTFGGWVSIDTVTNDFQGDFTVSKLDLGAFVNDTANWSGKTISGKVDLRIPGLAGRTNDIASIRSGEGCSLAITEGQLLDVPGIINFLNPIGGGGRFTAMKAYFDIHEESFHIKEFAFLGKEGSGAVLGRGRFGFDGKFKLKIRTETASIFGIDFIITSLPGKLIDLFKAPFKITVEGTLEASSIIE